MKQKEFEKKIYSYQLALKFIENNLPILKKLA